MMLSHLQRAVVFELFAVFTMVGGARSASAQISYTVFPAQPENPSPLPAQPTGHGVTLVVRDSTIKYIVNELARQAHLQPS